MVLITATLLVIIPIFLCLWWISLLSFTYLGADGPLYPISPVRWLLSIAVPLYIGIDSIRKKKLDSLGAMMAFVMGIIMMLSSYSFFLALVAFFYTGSKLTRFRASRKSRLEEDYKEGGQRTWIQVFTNGGIPTLYAAHYILESGLHEQPLDFANHFALTNIALSVLCGIACVCGDTWASEVGSVVGSGDPFLITTLQRVPRGTNGGVSFVGTVMSAAGGMVVGLGYLAGSFLTFSREALENSPPQWPVILFSGLAGLMGSLIDSLLGACLQYSGYCKRQGKVVHQPSSTTTHISGMAVLDNEGVNLVSCWLTALIMPHVCCRYWHWLS
ncbi:transmembrane protein 19-like [Diadema setosum]|uniref:transmembrane protein 19-like n=1 Tax=Diadema setosum TaxID=31175 RepID=UPI003B3A635D